jgi:hypothetical protein
MFRFLLRHSHRPGSRSVRLKVEVLEDRAIPAIINVNSLADILSPGAGVVTLRSAIQSANTTAVSNIINLTVPGTYKIALLGTAQEDDNAAGEFAYTGTANLTIANTSGGTVIVDGGGLNRVFDINPGLTPTAAMVTFQGFTITDGMAAPGDLDFGSGGGIRCQGLVQVVLTSMVLQNNYATADGGGIAMESTSVSVPCVLTINSSSINDNHAGDSGGGVEADGAGSVFIGAGTEITNNTAVNQGGGVWLDAISDGVDSVTIANGGSGYNTAPTVTFSAPNLGGTFASGIATITAGVVTAVRITNPGMRYTSPPTVTFSPPSSGTTATGTANLGKNSATLGMTGTTVADNRAINMLGGGIGNGGDGGVFITDCVIQNNTSGTTGGGFGDAANTGSLNVVNSYFLNNAARLDGGGIQEGAPTVTISGTTFQGNISQGSAGTTGPISDGGGLFVNGPSVTLSDCVFRQNVAIDGGGMADQAAIAVLTNCTFDTNRTLAPNGANGNNPGPGGFGGAIDVNGASGPSLNVLGCLFLDNTAAGDTGGGAIAQASGTLDIENSQFTGNVTAGQGGAVYFSSTATNISISNSTFNLNRSLWGGAVFTAGSGAEASLDLDNDTFVGNAAGVGGGGAIAALQSAVLFADTINNNTSLGSGGGIELGSNELQPFNCIFALNTAAMSGPDVFGTVSDLGGNLITNSSGSTGFTAGTLSGNPLLGRPENNGGVFAGAYSDRQIVQTEALLPASPAFGTGSANGNSGPDQRGFPRRAGGRANPSIGAYEPQYTSAATANQIYVENLYEVLLNRTAVGDPGAAGWVTALKGGTAAAVVVAAIESSGEYLGDRVQLLYQRFLHRSAGSSEQAAYVNLLQHGVTFQQVIQGIAGSDEYFRLHGGTSAGFVVGLYEDLLNRGAAPTEVDSWLTMLGSASRAQAVAGFLGSTEYVTDLVEDNYVHLLGRRADPAGLSYFVTFVQSGGTYQILVADLLGSGEAFAART